MSNYNSWIGMFAEYEHHLGTIQPRWYEAGIKDDHEWLGTKKGNWLIFLNVDRYHQPNCYGKLSF